MRYSGIDLHKRSLVIDPLDADGATTREAQLKSDHGAHRRSSDAPGDCVSVVPTADDGARAEGGTLRSVSPVD